MVSNFKRSRPMEQAYLKKKLQFKIYITFTRLMLYVCAYVCVYGGELT